MTSSNTKRALARISAESGERVRASASSVASATRHVEASRKALDQSLETLANTARRCSSGV